MHRLKNPLRTSNAAKIEVFTVGFQVSRGQDLPEELRHRPDHYYDATTGDALKAAFRDIA